MTRMYLSPTASTFAKIGLIFVECLIGFYNLITYPIRKITLKAYLFVLVASGVLYAALFPFALTDKLVLFFLVATLFTVSIFVTRMLYKLLNQKISPRVAYLISSPLGIPLNRFHKLYTNA